MVTLGEIREEFRVQLMGSTIKHKEGTAREALDLWMLINRVGIEASTSVYIPEDADDGVKIDDETADALRDNIADLRKRINGEVPEVASK